MITFSPTKIAGAYVGQLDLHRDTRGYFTEGFRYDMVKGFDGSHVADYNDATGVEYSVGEYWDGNRQNRKLDKQN